MIQVGSVSAPLLIVYCLVMYPVIEVSVRLRNVIQALVVIMVGVVGDNNFC